MLSMERFANKLHIIRKISIILCMPLLCVLLTAANTSTVTTNSVSANKATSPANHVANTQTTTQPRSDIAETSNTTTSSDNAATKAPTTDQAAKDKDTEANSPVSAANNQQQAPHKARHATTKKFQRQIGSRAAQGMQTLTNAMRITVKTNPAILSAEAKQLSARESIGQAQAGYLPKVNLIWGVGREHSDSPSTAFRGVTMERQERQATFSQLLWDFWGTIHQIRSNRYQFQATAFQSAEQREITGLRVTEVYLDILRFAMLMDIADTNVGAHRVTLQKVRLRFQGGAGQKADIDLADSRLDQAISTLLASQGLLRDARAGYLHVVGLTPYHLTMPRLPRLPRNMKQALALAYHASPSIKAAKKNLAVAYANLKVAKANFYPRFTLEGGVSNNRNLDGIRGRSKDALGMVMVRYNLVNGGNDVATIRKSLYDVYTARNTLAEVKRTVRENVMSAWNNYDIAKQRVIQLANRVIHTQDVLVAYQKQFELGQRSLLNLVDTERELFNARSDLINGRFLVYTSAYRMLASMGTLTRTLGAQPNCGTCSS